MACPDKHSSTGVAAGYRARPRGYGQAPKERIMSQAGAARGIVFTCLAMFCFILNDVLVKAMGHSMPAGQIMILRGLISGAMLVAIMAMTGGMAQWRMLLQWPVVVRTLCDAAATLAYIGALAGMPVASLVAMTQIVPILTAAAGALLFHEQVDGRRWMALAIGFGGVMVVVRPGLAALDLAMLLALFCVVLLTTRDIATRQAPDSIPALLIASAATLAVPPITAPLMAGTPWSHISWQDGALLMVVAICVAAGNWLLILAMRKAPLSTIAPFRYTAIPFAVVLSFFIGGEIPDLLTVLGAGMIALGGILAVERSRPAR